MGSMAVGRLSSSSDLDLLVIYDADISDVSDGQKPLAVTTYFGRLTKALVAALSAPTASEAMALLERGSLVPKFFPAEASGGAPALKAIGSPIPHIQFRAR